MGSGTVTTICFSCSSQAQHSRVPSHRRLCLLRIPLVSHCHGGIPLSTQAGCIFSSCLGKDQVSWYMSFIHQPQPDFDDAYKWAAFLDTLFLLRRAPLTPTALAIVSCVGSCSSASSHSICALPRIPSVEPPVKQILFHKSAPTRAPLPA